MEALLESNSNLTKEEIMWAASNLPDTAESGSFKVQDKMVFNHDAESFFDSIGITEPETVKIAEIFADATKKLLLKENYVVSQAVEHVMTETENIKAFNALIISKLLKDGIDKVFSKDSPMNEILNLLKKFGDSSSKD